MHYIPQVLTGALYIHNFLEGRDTGGRELDSKIELTDLEIFFIPLFIVFIDI